MPNKSPEEHYREQFETFMEIPDDKLAGINMPPEEAMQEGKRVSALVEKFKKQLMQSGIEPELLRTVDARAEAYAYSVAQCDVYVKAEGENRELLKVKKPEGYALRTKILKSFDYIFRNDPGLLQSVAGIREGRGYLEMLKDLLSIHKLCSEQKELLEKSNFQMELVGQSMKLHEELAGLTSQVDIDPEKIDEAKAICAKAWTYLHAALREIYAAGRYVFMDEPEIEELFYNDYLQKKQRMASRSKEADPIVEAVPA